MGIRHTLLLIFLLIGLAPSITLTGLAFYQAREALQLEITHNLKNEASALMEDIDRMMFERVLQVHTWSHLEIMEDVRVGDVDKRLSHFLYDLNNHYEGVYRRLICTNPQGQIVAASDASLVGKMIEERGAWLTAQLAHGQTKIAPLNMELEPDKATVEMEAAIHDPSKNKDVGVLHALFEWQEILNLLDHTNKGSDNASSASLAVLFDDHGRIIAASKPLRERGLLLSEALSSWRTSEGDNPVITDSNKFLGYSEVLSGSASGHGYRGFPGFGWTVQVYRPTAIAFAPIHRMAIAFLLLLVITSATAVVLSIVIARRIARPILHLTELTRNFMHRQHLAEPTKIGQGEVGELTESFQHMICDLQQSRDNMVRAAKLAVVGEMAATMAHEVRMPLGIMRSSAQMLQREPSLSETGKEMLDFIRRDAVDLIISDLQMPVMNGLELLKSLREENIDTPCIIITAYGTVETAVAAMKHGATDYIIRPFDVSTVELAITRVLAIRQIKQQNAYLREVADNGWGEFIGHSPAMRKIYEMIQQVAQSKTNVLIVGETGTGKELVARAVHQASSRRNALFVPVNCAAIPGDLLESEMFGYARGAFTGAFKDKPGKFEMAQGGTLFLDEITEMSPRLQAKLLRVLQENIYERLGCNVPIDLDVRIIAATNQDPMEAVKKERLREDLYYRIKVFAIPLPPLRERPEDIPLLVEHFVHKLAAKLGISSPAGVSPEFVEHFKAYPWPGNVREMENVMERAMVLSRGKLIDLQHLPQEISTITQVLSAHAYIQGETQAKEKFALEPAVEQFERGLISEAIEHCKGNKTKAARLLEISERTLWYKLKKYEMNYSGG